MDRSRITSAVVEAVDRMLASRLDHATIASQLGITRYVVGVITGDKHGKGRKPRAEQSARQVINAQRGVDAATIRMIQRMLEVGFLNQKAVAREAGVSMHVVSEVALGRRRAVTGERPCVFKDLGERFLPEPIRCSVCRAKILIVPCRACRARREIRRRACDSADDDRGSEVALEPGSRAGIV